MKKFKLIILLMLMASMFSILTLTSCKNGSITPSDEKTISGENPSSGNKLPSGNSQDIENECAYQGFYENERNPFASSNFGNEKTIVKLVDSKVSLVNFCNEKALPVFDSKDKNYNDDFCKKLRGYDDSFFQSASLVLSFELEESEDIYRFDSFETTDKSITINLLQSNGYFTTQSRSSAYVFVIDKKHLQSDTQIKFNKIDNTEYDVKIYKYSQLNIKENRPFVISSKEELMEFCNEDTSSFFKKNELTINDAFPHLSDEQLKNEYVINMYISNYVELNKSAIEKLNTYEKDFFQDKSLVCFIISRGDNKFYRFKAVDISDNSLNVTVSTHKDKDSMPILGSTIHLYLLEIDKDMISNTTQVNIKQLEE